MKEEFLRPHQVEAVKKMKNGCILNGKVGSGKSRTGLYYYFHLCGGYFDENGHIHRMVMPKDLYIITTARKRDTLEWVEELAAFNISVDPDVNFYKNKIVIDSWNNIKKYRGVYGAFFIFDEDRLTGSGVWVKSFLDISRKNKWIILSATPGDSWIEYWSVFVANGFYKNKTDFINQHCIYARFSKYPRIERYVNEKILQEHKADILIDMNFEHNTVQHHVDVWCEYNRMDYRDLMKNRWNIFENRPVENASELCYLLRKCVNSDLSRVNALLDIYMHHPKMIIFYSYDYELDILRSIPWGPWCQVAEWNGHKHEKLPTGEEWVYFVQYTSGCEGWNCITTDTIVFFSQQYSYKVLTQACGRTNRMNTPFKELYYFHLKSHSSIDMSISRALKNKKDFNERRFVK